jgi:hypothetical protein
LDPLFSHSLCAILLESSVPTFLDSSREHPDNPDCEQYHARDHSTHGAHCDYENSAVKSSAPPEELFELMPTVVHFGFEVLKMHANVNLQMSLVGGTSPEGGAGCESLEWICCFSRFAAPNARPSFKPRTNALTHSLANKIATMSSPPKATSAVTSTNHSGVPAQHSNWSNTFHQQFIWLLRS